MLNSNLCHKNNLNYELNSNNNNIKNAITCAIQGSAKQDFNLLDNALKFIYLYLSQSNNSCTNLSSLEVMIDSLLSKLNNTQPLDANSLKVMTDISYILNLLRSDPYSYTKNEFVIKLLKIFQTRLNITFHFLFIEGSTNFLNYFRSLFTNYGAELLIDFKAIKLFSDQFLTVHNAFKKEGIRQQDFIYATHVIVDLCSVLSYHLAQLNKKKLYSNLGRERAFSVALYRRVFSLLDSSKTDFYMYFLRPKWSGDHVEANEECIKYSIFCEIIQRDDILPLVKTLAIGTEFNPTLQYKEPLHEEIFTQLITESYLGIQQVYNTVFNPNSFKNKTFNPEIFIFPDQATYQKYGYSLFGFQTNNGGQTFIADLQNKFSCHIAIFLIGPNQFLNLAHELAHCYEGAASLQSGFANVHILPDSVRESVPQYIQNLVLANAGIRNEQYTRLTLGALDKAIPKLIANFTQIEKDTLLSKIINEPDGSIHNYYKATLLAAFLVENNFLKEIIGCTDGKKQKNERNACIFEFSKLHNTRFQIFLDKEILNDTSTNSSLLIIKQPTASPKTTKITLFLDISRLSRDLILAIYGNRTDRVTELLSQGANPNYRDPHTNQTPLHFLANYMICNNHMIQELLQYGADIEVADAAGTTPYGLLSQACPDSTLEKIKPAFGPPPLYNSTTVKNTSLAVANNSTTIATTAFAEAMAPPTAMYTAFLWKEVILSLKHGLLISTLHTFIDETNKQYFPEDLLKSYLYGKGKLFFSIALASTLPFAFGATPSTIVNSAVASLAMLGIMEGAKGVIEHNKYLKPFKTSLLPTLSLAGNIVYSLTNGKSLEQNIANTSTHFLAASAGKLIGKKLTYYFFKKPEKPIDTHTESLIQNRAKPL